MTKPIMTKPMKTSFRRSSLELLLGICVVFPALGLHAQSSEQTATVESEKYDFGTFHLAVFTDGNIPTLLSKTKGDVILSDSEEWGMQVSLPDKPGEPPFQVLAKTCEADLVVAATAVDGVSHMTVDKNFLYTDWTFHVDEVLKSNSVAPIFLGEAMTVVRPGGALRIGGRKVRANVLYFTNFESGRSYLLCLKLIPETKAYRADSRNSIPLVEDATDPVFGNPTRLREDTRAAAAIEIGKSEGDWSTSFCAGGDKTR